MGENKTQTKLRTATYRQAMVHKNTGKFAGFIRADVQTEVKTYYVKQKSEKTERVNWVALSVTYKDAQYKKKAKELLFQKIKNAPNNLMPFGKILGDHKHE